MQNSAHLLTEKTDADPFYAPFLKHVEAIISPDDEAKVLLKKHCRSVQFEKGQRIQSAGTVCKFVYFIVSGECISYHTDGNGRTNTWFFHFNQTESSFKNLFAVDYKSFLSRAPGNITIEALSSVTALRFSLCDVKALTIGSRAIERWLQVLNESVYMQTYDRLATLLTMSAPERYDKLLRTEPHLLNMFSNYLIATYLNIAPQSLSRIRKQITSAVY